MGCSFGHPLAQECGQLPSNLRTLRADLEMTSDVMLTLNVMVGPGDRDV